MASDSDGSVNVTVAAPTEVGSPPLSNYTLTIVPVNGTGGNITVYWDGSVDGSGAPNFILPYGVLSPYVDYSFYATAVSTAGSGPPSDPYDYVDPDTCLVQDDVCVLAGRRRSLLFATPPCCTGTLCVDAYQGMVCAGTLKGVGPVSSGDGIAIDGPLLNITFRTNYAGAQNAGACLLLLYLHTQLACLRPHPTCLPPRNNPPPESTRPPPPPYLCTTCSPSQLHVCCCPFQLFAAQCDLQRTRDSAGPKLPALQSLRECLQSVLWQGRGQLYVFCISQVYVDAYQNATHAAPSAAANLVDHQRERVHVRRQLHVLGRPVQQRAML